MGITYLIDAPLGIVRERWVGRITTYQMVIHWNAKLGDPQVMRYDRTLADVRACQFSFSGEELRRLVKSLLEPELKGRALRTAILVKEPIQYGVARQFQVYFCNVSEVSIFEDEREALEWVLQTPAHASS